MWSGSERSRLLRLWNLDLGCRHPRSHRRGGARTRRPGERIRALLLTVSPGRPLLVALNISDEHPLVLLVVAQKTDPF